MSIFILGHGDEPRTAPTFLPAGVTVSVYAPIGSAVSFGTAMQALAGSMDAPVVAVYEKSIPNYILSMLDPEPGAAARQVAENHDRAVVFVGDGTDQEVPLCADIPGCRDRGQGRHICNGLLGYLGQSRDPDYHMLACTGDFVADDTTSDEEVRRFILDTLYDDQKAQWMKWDDDKRAQMLSWNAVRAWRHNLYLESFCNDHGGGDWAIFRYYAGLEDEEREFFDDDGVNIVIKESYREAIGRVTALAVGGHVTNAMTVEDFGNDVREWENYVALCDSGVINFSNEESSESGSQE